MKETKGGQMRHLVNGNKDLVWDDVNSLFNQFTTPFQEFEKSKFSLSTNVEENETNYLVSVDVPGMRSEDINIESENGQLVITGERTEERKLGDEGKYNRVEKTYGKFTRSFTLPENVNQDEIEAHYENGVLEILMHKAERASPKKVKVKTGENGFLTSS